MRFYLLAILLLILQPTIQSKCNLGCLACKKTTDVDFECVVCDLFNQYALNESGLCEKNPIENCEIASPDQSRKLCTQCKSGYVLDYNALKCVEIPDISLVDKCVSYLGLNHCVACEAGHYVNEGLCVAVTTEVEGCVQYNDTGANCLHCENGKYLKSDGTCVSFDTQSNCVLYSKKKCVSCKAGYLKELNYFSSDAMSSSLAENFILSIKKGEGQVVPPSPRVCLELNIPHCQVYKNFKACAECSTGYFIDFKRECSLNPPNEIANCKYYQDMETCKECEMTHFLASNECLERTMVENCEEYQLSSSQCLKCDNHHYLNVNECIPRNLSLNINYCVKKVIDADKCEECKARFKLTNDKLKCLFQIDHCVTYDMAQTSFHSESLVCSECEQGYYFEPNNGQVCHAQDVANCKDFAQNSKNCSVCDEGFYLNSTDNKCEPYSVNFCFQPKTAENKCEVCLGGFYNDNGECKAYTVTNCDEFSETANECVSCINLHYKKDNNCYKYNLVGCADFNADENECTECASEYYLDSASKTCIKNNLNNCVLASKTANECLECADNYYLDTTDKKCMLINAHHCKPGMVDQEHGYCLSNGCEDDYFYDSSNNLCVKPFLPFCKKYSSLSVCTECEDDYFLYSSECHLGTTPFCSSYASDSVICDACVEGYYLYTIDPNNKKCLPQVAEGCLEFTNKSSLSCATCHQGYWKSNNVCYPYTVQNCDEMAVDADECVSCLSDPAYLLDVVSKNCIRVSLDGCTTAEMSNGQIKCTTCEDAYVLSDTNYCVPHVGIDFCIETEFDDTSANNKTKCATCGLGYYEDSGTCTKIPVIDNCLEYSPNANKCLQCAGKYTGDDCTTEKADECLANDGTNCILCQSGFEISSNDCVAETATAIVDPNCHASVAASTCVSCKENYVLATFTAKRSFRIENCIAFDSTSTDKCTQCKKGYYVQNTGASKNYECVKDESPVCLQKQAVVLAGTPTADPVYLLSDATLCSECADKTTYILDSSGNTCTARVFFVDNCSHYQDSGTVPETNSCDACKENYSVFASVAENSNIPLSYGICLGYNANGSSDIEKGAIDFCDVYNIAADGTAENCQICRPDKELAADFTSCNAPSSSVCSVQSYFDPKTTSFKSSFSAKVVTNSTSTCVFNSNEGVQEPLCAGLKIISDFAASLSEWDSASTVPTIASREAYNPTTKELDVLGDYISTSSCIATITTADLLQSVDNLDPTSITTTAVYTPESLNNCEYGFNDTSKYYCVRCKAGYNPHIVKGIKTGGSDVTTDVIPFIVCDEEVNGVYRANTSIFNPYSITALNPNDLIDFDSCTDPSKTLFVFIQPLESGTSGYYWSVSADHTKHSAYTCTSSANATQTAVTNCQYYITDPGTDLTSATATNTKCGSCKPGFSATYDGTTNSITACTAITNCDTSAANTWLNACETCLSGYAYVVDGTNIKFDECMEVTGRYQTDHCKIAAKDSTNSNHICLVCERGYGFLESGDFYTCVPIDKTENGCAIYGKEPTLFNSRTDFSTITHVGNFISGITSTADTYTFLYLHSFMTHYFKDTNYTNAHGCISCSSTVHPIDSSEKNPVPFGITAAITSGFSQCINIFNSPYNILPNCKNMALDPTNLKCHECYENYVLDVTNGICYEDTKFANGIKAFTPADGTATQCREDYELVSDTCVYTKNCESHDSTNSKCSICKKGYIADIVSLSNCVPIPLEHPCEEFILGICVKCKNGRIPYTVKGTNQFPIVYCSFASYASVDSDITPFTSYADIVIITPETDTTGTLVPASISVDLSESTPTISTTVQALAGFFQITSNGTNSFRANICMSMPEIPHCAEYDTSTGLCKLCTQGYYFSAVSVSCIKGTVNNCKKYLYSNVCEICQNGFYNDFGVCKVYTVTNCAVKVGHKDECKRCVSGYYLDNDYQCQRDNSKNCLRANPYGGTCVFCDEHFRLNDNGNCEYVNLPGCLLSENVHGVCTMCETGYYLNSGACEKISKGCEIAHQGMDICFKCQKDYYIDATTSKCSQRSNLNCLLTAPFKDFCLKCHLGSYMKEGKCFPYSVSNCSVYNPNKDSCIDCIEDYQLTTDFQCIASTDPGCSKPSRYLNGCIQCEDGYYYDQTNMKCKAYTSKCNFYHPTDDLCLSCFVGQYLAGGKCEDNIATNCLEYSISSNVCLTCPEGFYLDNSGNCKMYTTQNCQVYNSFEDNCFKCNSGFYLNQNLTCQLYSFSACQIFDLYSDGCYRCEDEFYVDDNRKCSQRHSEGCNGVVLNADRCLGCNPGYYLQNGLCHQYTQTLCKVYDSFSDNCLSCQSNSYYSGGNCISYKKTNCSKYHQNLDGCTACPKEHYLDNYSCFEYDLDHCEEPHPNDNLCIKCEDGPWFRNGHGLCQEVTEVEHCMTYNSYFDQCEECSLGYFLANKICNPNPSGVAHCTHYLNEEDCGKCEVPYYLKENQCFFSSTLIPMCSYYSHDSSCGKCETGFFLEANECIQSNLTCATYLNRENCASCGVNEVLDPTGSQIKCVPSGIDNCHTAEFVSDGAAVDPAIDPAPAVTYYQCTQCAKDHYLNFNECVSVTAIDNCNFYESETLCKQCDSGFLLSVDKTACTAITGLGSGCDIGEEVENPVCSVCNEGYVLDDSNECVECTVTGCSICDVLNKRKCKLCKEGYHMTELFYCLEISSVESQENDYDEILQGTQLLQVEGSQILSISMILLIAITFFNKE